MSILHELERLRKPLFSKTSRYFRGFITIMAFSDSGSVRRFQFQKRLLFLVGVFLLAAILGSSLTFIQSLRGHYNAVRLAFLERENKALTTLLEGQAEQLEKLRAELGRLKEFEQNIRAISGLNSPGEPIVGTGDGGERSVILLERRRK